MHTYIVFKPETTSRCLVAVIKFLREKFPGIGFITHSDIKLSEAEVLMLYSDDMPPAIKAESVNRLANCSLTVIQVTNGAETVAELAHIRGSNVDPAQCELGTLRRILWNELGCEVVELGGGLRYYPNFVHIPQNEREASVCESLFGKHFNKK